MTQDPKDQMVIVALAELKAELRSIDQRLKDIKDKVDCVEKESIDTRIAVGKLEAKNAGIATVLGALTGFFSSKLGGGGGH